MRSNQELVTLVLMFVHQVLTPPPADVTPITKAIRIIASNTAYSTAVVALSDLENLLIAERNLMES